MTDYTFNRDLQANGGKSISLEMGSIVHTYLETKYKSLKNGIKKAEAIAYGMTAALAYSKNKEEVNNSTSEDIALALDTCIQYENHYKNDSWETQAVEEVRSKEIYEDDKLRIIWKAKFDWIVNVPNQMSNLAVDHKTMKQRRDSLNLNNQFTGQVLLTGNRLMFVNKIGFQKSLKLEERFTRAPINYTAARLEEWSKEIVPYWAYKLVEYAENKYWPANYTHCENKYGFCRFKEVCESNPNMREEVIRINFYKGKKWDIGNDTTPDA
jgi:hypothetical protein